jgi:hypothetical protein
MVGQWTLNPFIQVRILVPERGILPLFFFILGRTTRGGGRNMQRAEMIGRFQRLLDEVDGALLLFEDREQTDRASFHGEDSRDIFLTEFQGNYRYPGRQKESSQQLSLPDLEIEVERDDEADEEEDLNGDEIGNLFIALKNIRSCTVKVLSCLESDASKNAVRKSLRGVKSAMGEVFSVLLSSGTADPEQRGQGSAEIIMSSKQVLNLGTSVCRSIRLE